MIELLDDDFIAAAESDANLNYSNFDGSWHCPHVLDKDMEEDKIIAYRLLYNPYKSVIRDTMCFVERTILSCMIPGCNYQESRYVIRNIFSLPLIDHAIDINVQIRLFESNQDNQQLAPIPFTVLDYCSIDTLRCQVFQVITKQQLFVLEDIDQIRIMKDRKYVDPTRECKILMKSKILLLRLT